MVVLIHPRKSAEKTLEIAVIPAANPAYLIRPKVISQEVVDLTYPLESLKSPYTTSLIGRVE